MHVAFLKTAQIRSTVYSPGEVADIDPEIGEDFIRRGVAEFRGWGDYKMPTWTDLAQGAVGVNPAGVTDPPAVDTTETGFPGTYLFRGTVGDHLLAGQWQILHEWAQGTALRPHIHWMLTADSAAEVTWEFYYRVCGTGEAAAAWVGPVGGTLALSHGGLANVHAITTFGDIPLTGKKASCIVIWRLYRRVADANNDDARLLSIDAHYLKDGTGSETEYEKKP